MDIKNYIENLFLLQRENTAEIIAIYKTGSQLFTESPRDLDYMILCRNYMQRYKRVVQEEGDDKYDFIITDIEAMNAMLDFNDLHYVHKDLKIWNYFTQIRPLTWGEDVINWDMLSYEVEYKQYIKELYDRNVNRLKDPTRRFSGKFYVHYYIVLKMYDNNSVELTEDMMAEVALLYANTDECYPVIDWTREQMNLI